ncbi:hypothetical protein BgiBS90_012149 [Biomphalaria glabrata]|nr:hypothetical protein BgiBS90_012149 [Biomphalaria glabrata]
MHHVRTARATSRLCCPSGMQCSNPEINNGPFTIRWRLIISTAETDIVRLETWAVMTAHHLQLTMSGQTFFGTDKNGKLHKSRVELHPLTIDFL